LGPAEIINNYPSCISYSNPLTNSPSLTPHIFVGNTVYGDSSGSCYQCPPGYNYDDFQTTCSLNPVTPNPIIPRPVYPSPIDNSNSINLSNNALVGYSFSTVGNTLQPVGPFNVIEEPLENFSNVTIGTQGNVVIQEPANFHGYLQLSYNLSDGSSNTPYPTDYAMIQIP